MVLRFILRCLLMALPVVIALAGYLYLRRHLVPAPQVTVNYALNEKIALAHARMATGVDVLALGSSMALNNIDSRTVIAAFGTERYLNMGAWGVGTSETAMLAPALVERLRPRTVLLATNLMDFTGENILRPKDSSAVVQELDGSSHSAYLRHWNAPYYLRQMELNKVRLADPANYEYFGLDAYGAATLNVPPERIDQRRFDQLPTAEAALREDRYRAFEALARALHDQGVHLMVWQCAYRDGLRTAEHRAVAARHVARLKAIAEPLGHRVVDGNERSWADALYADASHMGPEGAAAFTAFCLEQAGH